VDLAEIFKHKYYYHPKMNGSYSIKKILGILVPEMEKAYKNLDSISKGSDAMQAFPSLRENKDQEEELKINEERLKAQRAEEANRKIKLEHENQLIKAQKEDSIFLIFFVIILTFIVINIL
jgi:hypothetical protein